MKSSGPVVLNERPVQFRGSKLARWCLKWAGWTLDFDGMPARQGVIVVYPHTSNWDFILGIFAKWAMGMPANFWGKDSLFRVPLLGQWLSWLGGVPVNRSSPRGMVGDMVDRMQRAKAGDRFQWLVLAPEGTRSLTAGWRSGFYRVACGAEVPLGLAYLDYGRRRVGMDTYLQLSGDRALDMHLVAERLAGVQGCEPERASPVQLNEL
jgi:1-acyl-sn-glycerol-3-phosphate acyltransferase